MNKLATLVGLAIGDALGSPFEMRSDMVPFLQKEWDGMFKDGSTFWKGKAGQYTDDTLMAIALSKSLINCNGFVPEDVGNEYLNWYKSGNLRGIGRTTAMAIKNLKKGYSWEKSGLEGSEFGGNGTAMRVAPIGIVYRNSPDLLLKFAIQDAIITHNSFEPQMGSVALGVAIIANTKNKLDIIKNINSVLLDSVVKTKLEYVQKAIDKKINYKKALSFIGSGGYVPETVGAAFYCFLTTNSFQDAVVRAVKAAGDTDSVAAVTGALAGTYYGLDGIPDYYKTVEDFSVLSFLDEKLFNISS